MFFYRTFDGTAGDTLVSVVAAYADIETISQEEVIRQYSPLVKRIAHHLSGRLPSTVQIDDLIQAGMIGLLEATKNYDASKGASFETYAGIRIRGTMLDEVRRNDWLPRSLYRKSRMIAAATRQVENNTGRDAKDNAVAAVLGININDYHQIVRETHSGQLFTFDDDEVMQQGFAAAILGPYENVQRDDLCKTLSVSIELLPEREKLVLSLYYDDELNLKEIGQVLGVSESRVCQIHTQAMHRLQIKLIAWRGIC